MERKRSPRCAAVDSRVCVSCGTCLMVCHRQALSVVHGCYALVDSEKCIGCSKCAKVCPVGCISIFRREAAG